MSGFVSVVDMFLAVKEVSEMMFNGRQGQDEKDQKSRVLALVLLIFR
jgi:hypothetical protein